MWDHVDIVNDFGLKAKAQAPIIISASRATDIPAFYAEWFFQRLKKGYIMWINPFNGNPNYVSFQKTRLIVFWSKNPKPILKYLDYLDKLGINYYFQFTLNDYEKEKLELNVPKLDDRIKTFIELSERVGKQRIIWRFDPYILTETSDVDELLKRTENIGNVLKDYTEKLVFSFADIKIYKKVALNLKNNGIKYFEFTEKLMHEIAQRLSNLNNKWNLELATCSECIDLIIYGIKHNKCIDDDLIVKLFNKDKELMDFIGYEPNVQLNLFSNDEFYKYKIGKDKGQRKACGCIVSKDIGQYNTCPHHCIYCYANVSPQKALENFKKHKQNPDSETIINE